MLFSPFPPSPNTHFVAPQLASYRTAGYIGHYLVRPNPVLPPMTAVLYVSYLYYEHNVQVQYSCIAINHYARVI